MAVAAFGMLFTSCAKDDAASNGALVSFTVNAPEVSTRYGEGTTATTLSWAVYDENGAVEALKGSKPINLSTNVDLKLIQGRTYHVLFWAADAKAPYEVDWDAKTMVVNYDALSANQESYDAFYKYEDLGTVNGAMQRNIELTRPFAQLNIATGDKVEAEAAELVVAQTEVTVKNIFSTLDFATGAVSDEVETTFELADRANGTITANGKEYDQIAMNYLLVGGKKLVTVTLGINGELTRSYTSVPVERNYRTNIVGNLLTSPADFTVVILPGFIDDQEGYEPHPNKGSVDELVLAAQMGGEYTLTGDITLTEPLTIPEGVTFVLDLNGKTINTTNEDGYAIYNENGGTIRIIDTADTRSTESYGVVYGIVYTGANSTTIIDGGTFNPVEGGKWVLLNNGGSLTINQATINGGSSYPLYSYGENHKLVINDVTINAPFGCVNAYTAGGVVEINGGTYNMTGVQGKSSHIAYFSNVDVTINGGSFSHIGDISMSAAGGGGICAVNGTNLVIKGGSFAGDYADIYDWNIGSAASISIQGGTFKFNPAAWVAEGYVAVKNDDNSYSVIEGVIVKNTDEFVAAIQNAENGDIIVLDSNITLPAENMDTENSAAVLFENSNITLNLNGKTLTAGTSDRQKMISVLGGDVTIKNGKLEIISTNGQETGTGTSTGGSSAIYSEYANLTIEDVEIIGSARGGHRAIDMYGGESSIKNVKIDVKYGAGVCLGGNGAKVTLTDCDITISGMYSAPYNSTCFSIWGGAEMTIESGNYKIINNDLYATGASHGGWVGIVMSSGGKINLNGGTFTNVPATGFMPQYERPLFSVDATAGNTGVMNFNGGTYDPQEDQIIHKGGSGGTETVQFKGTTIGHGVYSVNSLLMAEMTDNGNGTWSIQ